MVTPERIEPDHAAPELADAVSAGDRNTARLTPDGPTCFDGDIVLVLADDDVRAETRVSLCRCGASRNKPYCDRSHEHVPFREAGLLPPDAASIAPAGSGELTITVKRNGPLKCIGPLALIASDGRVAVADETFLCRCGASGNKPYC